MTRIKIDGFNGHVVRNVIHNRKLNFGQKIRTVTIADLHSYTSNKDRADRLSNAVKKLHPDIIMIAGDIFNGGTPWNGGDKYEGVKYFVEDLSQECPVVITLGNHDLIKLDDTNREIRKYNFQSLENVNPGNVYPLFNDRAYVNGIEVVGFVPRYELMGGEGLQTQLHGIAHDEFIRDYNESGKKFEHEEDAVTVYLGHDPHLIGASENGVGLGDLKAADIFYTGHIHDGYKAFLSIIDKIKRALTGTGLKGLELDNGYTEQPTGVVDKDGNYIKGSRRLWIGPTNLCRGMVFLDDEAQQKYLQLPDDRFYKNASNEPNVQEWVQTDQMAAAKDIIDRKLHCMLISEGVSPSFLPKEKIATINILDIESTDDMPLAM